MTEYFNRLFSLGSNPIVTAAVTSLNETWNYFIESLTVKLFKYFMEILKHLNLQKVKKLKISTFWTAPKPKYGSDICIMLCAKDEMIQFEIKV